MELYRRSTYQQQAERIQLLDQKVETLKRIEELLTDRSNWLESKVQELQVELIQKDEELAKKEALLNPGVQKPAPAKLIVVDLISVATERKNLAGLAGEISNL